MNESIQTRPERVDPKDEEALVFWREKFGVTIDQLLEAIQAVGPDPADIKEHFLNQGSSAGAS